MADSVVPYDGSVPTASNPKIVSSKKTSITVLQADPLKRISWLIHGFSTRMGGASRVYGKGDLNLGFTKDDSESAVKRNRAAFLEKLGAVNRSLKAAGALSRKSKAPPCPAKERRDKDGAPLHSGKGGGAFWPVITLRQVHSDIVRHIEGVPEEPLVGDGMITATPGLLLAIQTADCLPVIVVDTRRHAVGVFHAGWRGTVKRIVEKGVGEMVRCFGSRPRDLRAAIGPGIQGCCYEVGEEVRTKFESQFEYAGRLFREVKESDPVRERYPLLFLTARAPGHGELPAKIYLDLVEANRQQLVAAGVPKKNIETSLLCTNCRPELLFSYRAEKGKTGRMMGVAGVRD
jgi:YfiH family protein